LNPEKLSFCIDSSRPFAELPIYINQTSPKSIELLRIDLDTNINETISVSGREVQKLKKAADKEAGKDRTGARTLRYQVKQTGVYRLTKFIDESNLDVQRVPLDTAVVPCPSASVKPVETNKCRGDLSNFYLEVYGTPPLKIKYSKKVNKGERSEVSLTVHPEEFDPLPRPKSQETAGALVLASEQRSNVSWARTSQVKIPINETLEVGGNWQYSINEVQDVLGNLIRYKHLESTEPKSTKPVAPSQNFVVREKPTVVLHDCSTQQPLKVAKGKSKPLPIWLNPTHQDNMNNLRHTVTYKYSPHANEESKEEEEEALEHIIQESLLPGDEGPKVDKPGVYSLLSVRNDFCSGEVMEPSSCLLLNPPEPDLSISTEPIPHQCAGNSVGLRINLDLIGTPPFHVSYSEQRRGSRQERHTEVIDSLRTQMEFKPRDPGQYTYEFLSLSDSVYQGSSLKHKNLVFEQSVRPTAWARFASNQPQLNACIGEPVSFDVYLSGEGPWILEYDLVHGGKRKKHKVKDITDSIFTLTTPSLVKGGQHALTLTSVTDSSGCKIFLEQEARIEVRHQRPTAAFGLVEGHRRILTLEGKKAFLPVKLSGDSPWSVSYSKVGSSETFRKTLRSPNDVLDVSSEGVYRLEEIRDGVCPGTVDVNANDFEVQWVPRPTLQVIEGSTIKKKSDRVFVKNPVCEGDQDTADVSFTGQSPYHMEYKIHGKPDRGQPWVTQTQQEDVALHVASIRMDTAQPGFYEYNFLKVGDRAYESGSSSPLPIIQQTINPRPSAKFSDTGKIYNYCKEQTSSNDVIPIALTGQPPFTLELSIRHHASTTPEIVNIPNIETRNYNFQIPHRALSLGTHTVSIRKVRDANGCEKASEPKGPAVRVNVVDMPTISPLEPQTDFCVGDRISFALAGTPPFSVYYNFEGQERRASESSTTFRRIAERPGNFTITAVSDKASTDSCRARNTITKVIHALPSVRISKGRTSEIDIHEGGEAELVFEFGGTPPFEFT
jgi:nucleoporin POM152